MSKSPVRLGIVGVGSMGRDHANKILGGAVRNIELAALCDQFPDNLAQFPDIPHFHSPEDLFRSGKVDAVLVATPHYSHTTLGSAALRHGLHVLVEKPISVHKADCERLIAAYRTARSGRRRPVFAAMFNMRTYPRYIKLRQLIQSGELGEIRRMNWIVTSWFRTFAYYASGGWRATWAGEGGGVLLNQCPHQLDLLQWLFGMPKKVRAFCAFGKYHDIEVEDDVTAYLEFGNGSTGVFITSTGEAPGTNRLEITGERGRLILEDGKIHYKRNETPMSEFSRTTTSRFAVVPHWNVEIPADGEGGHMFIVQNFVDAIRDGAELIAPATEGIHSVELGNAMLLSTFLDKTVDLPISGALFEKHLKQRIAGSKPKKPKAAGRKMADDDFAKSQTS